MIIIHFADIHKRVHSRHEEFNYVANEFYKKIEEIIKINKIDGIICSGDIFDNKTNLSTESVSWVIDLFSKLTEYSDVWVVNGNHDASLTNKDRKSALDLVYKFLKNNPKYHYLRESGIYPIGNNHYIGNFSVFDDEKKWPIEIPNKNGIYVAIFHGVLIGSKNEDNYKIESTMDPNYLFKNYEYCMAGDIHKLSFLDEYYVEKEIDESEIDDYKHELGFEVVK